jgi:hypothetical protein
MSQWLYCWRGMEIPMLEESEWEAVAPLLANPIQQIKEYRLVHGVSLAEASEKGFGQKALAVYEQLTGFRETNPKALWHHRVSLYGPKCSACGVPLRTPQATYCINCGWRPQKNS